MTQGSGGEPLGGVACLALGLLVSCGPTLSGFPCDYQGRCPGSMRCDLASATCLAGAACDSPLVSCGAACADTRLDPANCGA